MSEVDVIFAVAALFVVAVSLASRNWRAFIWLPVIAGSYVLSDIAWRSGFSPLHASALTAIGDGAVCLAFYFWWRERWEMWVWRLYQISCGISVYYAAVHLGLMPSLAHNAYSYMLETVNALALIIFLGTGIARWVGTRDGVALHSDRHVHPLVRALHRGRTSPPFTHKAR